MADETQKANLTKRRGALAAGMKDAGEKQKFIARSADADKKFDAVSNETEGEEAKQSREANVKQAAQVLGSYKKGGKVKETGVYELHEGEAVLPKDKKKAGEIAKDHVGKGLMAGLKSLAKDKEEKKDNKEEKSEKKGGKKHKFSRTEIEHHKNGSHTVRHHLQPSDVKEDMGKVQEPVSYSASDDADLQAKMTQSLGGGQEAPPVGAAQ